jgi:hypothetical protein
VNVYARTSVTRELIETDDGVKRLAVLEGRPVRRTSAGPWTFLGPAADFPSATALVKIKTAENTRAAVTYPLVRDRAYEETTSSVFLVSAPRRSGLHAGLQWYAYTGRGPRSGWAEVDLV